MNYTDRELQNMLEDVEAWSNGEGYWPMLLRKRYTTEVKNQQEWEDLVKGMKV